MEHDIFRLGLLVIQIDGIHMDKMTLVAALCVDVRLGTEQLVTCSTDAW